MIYKLTFGNDLMTIPESSGDKNYYIDFEVMSSTLATALTNAFTLNLGGSGLVEGDSYPVHCS